MIRSLLLTGTGAALALLALVGMPAAALAASAHPHMHHALYEMREARVELREASHTFGGHREKALDALNTAIADVDRALRGAGDNYRGIEPRRDWYRAYANHPHLRHALGEMRAARTQLREANHDFGGYRRQAVLALDVAINQIELALRFAR